MAYKKGFFFFEGGHSDSSPIPVQHHGSPCGGGPGGGDGVGRSQGQSPARQKRSWSRGRCPPWQRGPQCTLPSATGCVQVETWEGRCGKGQADQEKDGPPQVRAVHGKEVHDGGVKVLCGREITQD